MRCVKASDCDMILNKIADIAMMTRMFQCQVISKK